LLVQILPPRIANESGLRARLACATQKLKSKFRGLLQHLDHMLQQAPRAAAIEAAMIETERNLRLRYWNKFRFRFIPARCVFAGAKTKNHGLIGEGARRAPSNPEGTEVRDRCDSAALHLLGNATSAPERN